MDLRPHIAKFKQRFAEGEAALSDPAACDSPQRAQELSREYARLKDLLAASDGYFKCLDELEANRKSLAAEPPDSELAALTKEEIARLEAEEKRLALEV